MIIVDASPLDNTNIVISSFFIWILIRRSIYEYNLGKSDPFGGATECPSPECPELYWTFQIFLKSVVVLTNSNTNLFLAGTLKDRKSSVYIDLN